MFGTAVFLYGGWPFLQGAVARAARARLPGMMTLIALAISVAFVFSAAVTLGYPGHAALGGARDAGHDHAPGPLDRDALDLPGAGRARGAGEAAAGHRGSRDQRDGEPIEEVPVAALRDGRPDPGAPRREHPGRRHRSRGPQRASTSP